MSLSVRQLMRGVQEGAECGAVGSFSCDLFLHGNALTAAAPQVLVVVALALGLAVVFLLLAAGLRRIAREDVAYVLVVLFGLALIGTVSGFAAGLSRAPAVGAVIPAVLSLIGGVVLYLFGVSGTRQILPSLGATVLVLGLMISLATGASLRGTLEKARAASDSSKDAIEDLCGDISAELRLTISGAGSDVEKARLEMLAREVLSLCRETRK